MVEDTKTAPAGSANRRVTKSDIGGTWFGSGLNDAVRKRLARAARRLRVPAGAVLFLEGEDVPFFMIVADGRVGLSNHVPGRGDEMVLTVESGDIVGWSALLDPQRATLTATAIADLDAIVIDAAVLRKILAEECVFAAEVLRRTLESLQHRLTVTRWQLIDMYRPTETPYLEPIGRQRRMT